MTTRTAMQSHHALSAALREAAVAEYKIRAICKAAVDRLGNVAPFTDVRAAASHRARALAALAVRFGLPFPRDPFAPFRVGIPAYLSSYQACRAGANASHRNIALYEKLLALDLPPEVGDVLTRLLDGTRHHHLPAFERGARRDAASMHAEPNFWSA
jgi:hypothetical protein